MVELIVQGLRRFGATLFYIPATTFVLKLGAGLRDIEEDVDLGHLFPDHEFAAILGEAMVTGAWTMFGCYFGYIVLALAVLGPHVQRNEPDTADPS